MKNFFVNIKTIEELKVAYKKLARKLHPDVMETGNAELFKAMKDEYDRLIKVLKNTDKKGFEAHEKQTYDFKDIIDQLIFMENGDIEIIGSWIWVWGIKFEMVNERNLLKSLGFEWSKGRKAWCLGQKGQFWKKGMTKNEMRNTFGSQKIQGNYKPLLED